jgi:hypothetical protein
MVDDIVWSANINKIAEVLAKHNMEETKKNY